MAHTRQNVKARTNSSSNPVTTSITTPAGCTVLVLLIKVVGATTRTGGTPTWGGFAFTQIGQSPQIAAASPEASAELWYLLNPVQGTFTLSIPNAGTQSIFYTVEAGLAAAGGHSAFDASNGGNNTATNPTPGAITVSEAGGVAWAITAGGWTTWAPTPQAGTVIANTDDGADGGGEQFTLPSAGSLTLNWTFGTSDDWGACVAAFKEVPPRNLENYKSNAVSCVSAAATGLISVGERVR